MTNRIVLIDEGGEELFSGFSISSAPPAPPGEGRRVEPAKSLADLAEEVLNALDRDSFVDLEHDEACPPTLRSIAPAPSKETESDESGVFIRAAESRSRIELPSETSKKMVDERVA